MGVRIYQAHDLGEIFTNKRKIPLIQANKMQKFANTCKSRVCSTL